VSNAGRTFLMIGLEITTFRPFGML